jgi:hypothetical protein
VYFEREVAFDDVYVVAGYKGHPEAVKKRIVQAEEIGLKKPVVDGD